VLSKLFEGLYHKVFINIVIHRSKTVVYIEECAKDKVIQSVEESFKTTLLDVRMENFIKSYVNESPFHYISILDTSHSQGAAPTCKSKSFSQFFDINASKSLCYAERWVFYTSNSDLHMVKKEYARIGIDFVFSPFIVLARFFKDKIDTHMSMYVLIQESSLSLVVFDHSELLFADHLDMNHFKNLDDLSMDESPDIELDMSVNLDDVDVEDDVSELDDFGNIENLDDFEDMEEFSEMKDEPEVFSNDKEIPANFSEGLNEDYQRFSLIKNSLSHFYKDEKYKSQFVESVYIADAIGVSGDLKKYLEEEMFLSVFIRKIDLCAEICDLAKAEIK